MNRLSLHIGSDDALSHRFSERFGTLIRIETETERNAFARKTIVTASCRSCQKKLEGGDGFAVPDTAYEDLWPYRLKFDVIREVERLIAENACEHVNS